MRRYGTRGCPRSWLRIFALGIVLAFGSSWTTARAQSASMAGLAEEQIGGGGALSDALPLPAAVLENLRLAIDLASRANYAEERDAFFFQQFIGLDLHKVIDAGGRDLATLIVQVYGTRIDNVEPTPPIFEDDHDWEAVYRILNVNLYPFARKALNLRVGHFEIPFGLEYPLSTNGTLRDYQSTRNLGLKADWGVSLNGLRNGFSYELALTRGSGNEYENDGNPYTMGGRVGHTGFRTDLGLSGYYAQLPAGSQKSERWRTAIDGQIYEGTLGLLAEIGYGETDDRGVSNNLVELNWTTPGESVLVFCQSRFSIQEFARDWDEALRVSAGVRWTPDSSWSLSGQLMQDLVTFDQSGHDTIVSLQLRLRI